MYGYIYLTINLVNGKMYIGQHRNAKFDPKYHGSGVNLLKAIRKYGADNFETHILQECFSDEDLNASEIKFIAEYNAVDSDNYYNIARGGDGHTCSPWNKGITGITVSEQSLAALEYGRHLPSSEKHKKQLSERRTGCVVNEHTRKLLSMRAKGRISITNGIISKKIYPEQLAEYQANGWKQGSTRTYSEESYKKYQQTVSNKSQDEKNSINTRISETLKSKHLQWYTNGEDSVHIPESDAQMYIDKGYWHGRTLNKKK